ncbi:hypothetical protein [Amycolatopsis kentuckyensis]|uniref:hypothetical protein n=1 Tax=Amycolatopsis kentuckyensis TaxID=218823 RepID=UPI000A38D6C5|nr:hypothetical protein [Amycolatopsis kentuckyensis]
MTDRIEHLSLRWRPDADPGDAGRDRLAVLTATLVEHGLAGGLSNGFDDGRVTCVRHLRLLDLRAGWGTGDADLAAGWGRAVRRALAALPSADTDEVVRYRAVGPARQDLVIGVLRGDRRRVWAWRLLGLWPAARDDAPAGEVLDAVLRTAAADEPHTVTGLTTAVAQAGRMSALIDAVAGPVLTEAAEAAWRAGGGSVRAASRGTPQSDKPSMRQDLTGASTGSAGTPRDHPLPPDRAGAQSDSAAAARPGVSPARASNRSIESGAPLRKIISTSVHIGSLDRAPGIDQAMAFARLAILEVDPASVRQATSEDVLRAIATQLATGTTLATRRDTTRPSPGPGHDDGAVPVPGNTDPRGPIRRTGWGGLLFLLHLVGHLRLPDRVPTNPDRYGDELRPVLHELGRRICRRAAPAAGFPEPTDPAVLAFAGLPPVAEPPLPLPCPDLLDEEVDEVVAALRAALDAEAVPDQALLTRVCRREAVIEADPGWIDVVLRLDDVDVGVRRAGLDLDPDFLPWLGCVVRYRYG